MNNSHVNKKFIKKTKKFASKEIGKKKYYSIKFKHIICLNFALWVKDLNFL